MKQAKLSFEIELPDSSVSVDEWRRAQTLPAGELPQLSPEQKEMAHKFGITEEAYARSAKAGEFGHARMLAQAQKFGERVAGVLEELGAGVLDGVKSDPFRGRWLVRLRNPNLVLAFPRDLVEDLLDSEGKSYLEQVRKLVRQQLSAANEKAS